MHLIRDNTVDKLIPPSEHAIRDSAVDTHQYLIVVRAQLVRSPLMCAGSIKRLHQHIADRTQLHIQSAMRKPAAGTTAGRGSSSYTASSSGSSSKWNLRRPSGNISITTASGRVFASWSSANSLSRRLRFQS